MSVKDFFRAMGFKLNRPLVAAGMGGSVIHADTELVARKKVWDEKKQCYVYDGTVRRIKHRCVTDAFVAFIVTMLQTDTTIIGDFKYHDSGTGVGAEAAADVGLGTPWGGSRDVGTQVQGASANIYKSVATSTYNNTFAITEHGLFSQAASADAAHPLMDRTKFAAINVVNTNQIEWTFTITFTSGG